VIHTLLELLLLESGSQQRDQERSAGVILQVLTVLGYAVDDVKHLDLTIIIDFTAATATPLLPEAAAAAAAEKEEEPQAEAAETAEHCFPWSVEMLLLPLLHAASGIITVARQQMERDAQQTPNSAAAAAAGGRSCAAYVLRKYGCLLQKVAETSFCPEGAA
jgi:hypothetical protein